MAKERSSNSSLERVKEMDLINVKYRGAVNPAHTLTSHCALRCVVLAWSH